MADQEMDDDLAALLAGLSPQQCDELGELAEQSLAEGDQS